MTEGDQKREREKLVTFRSINSRPVVGSKFDCCCCPFARLRLLLLCGPTVRATEHNEHRRMNKQETDCKLLLTWRRAECKPRGNNNNNIFGHCSCDGTWWRRQFHGAAFVRDGVKKVVMSGTRCQSVQFHGCVMVGVRFPFDLVRRR